MSPTVRVNCDRCPHTASLPPNTVTLAVSVDGHHVRYECPGCGAVNVFPIRRPETARRLIDIGCHIEVASDELADTARERTEPLAATDLYALNRALDSPDFLDRIRPTTH